MVHRSFFNIESILHHKKEHPLASLLLRLPFMILYLYIRIKPAIPSNKFSTSTLCPAKSDLLGSSDNSFQNPLHLCSLATLCHAHPSSLYPMDAHDCSSAGRRWRLHHQQGHVAEGGSPGRACLQHVCRGVRWRRLPGGRSGPCWAASQAHPVLHRSQIGALLSFQGTSFNFNRRESFP